MNQEYETKIQIEDMQLTVELLDNYLQHLIGSFYKIIPMWESTKNKQLSEGEIKLLQKTLDVYIRKLWRRLMGFKELAVALKNDSRLVDLIAVLQFFIDHPQTDFADVRCDIFDCISIINVLIDTYG